MTKKTALYDTHQALGGLMVDFAGWQMPLHYGSQLDEHHTVRTDAGIFDVSHMCVVDVLGKEAKPFLERLLANNVGKLQSPGRALYGCMLNERGGIIDDLITYYLADHHYRVVVNAGTAGKDVDWIKQQANSFQVEIMPRYDLGILAVQGPSARKKAASALNQAQAAVVNTLKSFFCVEVGRWMIARTGYTGEDGVEIILPLNDIKDTWEVFLQAGIKPIGLGARDTLRLEAGLNLYGQDMTENESPLVSNLAWTVAFEPSERMFIGREALEAQQASGIKQTLVGLVLTDKGICRAKQTVWQADKEIGALTSGSFSPTLKCAIGMARVATGSVGDCFVDIRGTKKAAKLVALPFVKQGKPTF